MNFYIFQVLIFLIYSFFFYLVRPNFYKTYYIVTGLQLTFLMGLRSINVGSDTINNVNDYLINYNPDNFNFVYSFLEKISYSVSNGNFHFFIFLLSLITVYTYLYSIYLMQDSFQEGFLSVYLYVTLYYYFSAFNVQRQMLAVSISTLILSFLFSKKKIKSLIALLIAVGIHNTSLVTIIDFLIYRIKKSKKNLVLVGLVSVIFIFEEEKFSSLFTSLFDHYEIYSKGTYNASGGNIFYGLFILVFVLITVLINDRCLNNNKDGTLLYLSCIASAFYIVGAQSTLMIRIADYFGIYVPLFLPISIKYISSKFYHPQVVKNFLIMIIMICSFIILLYKLSKNVGLIIPYSF